MKWSEVTEAERERIATSFHEAAHAVQVVLAGGRVTRCALTSDTSGLCEYIDVPDHAERGVAYSGPWAEAHWRFGRNPALADIRAVLAGQDDHAELTAAGGGLPREIEPTLETCWSAVSSLAADLYRDGEIGHRQICEALGLPLWDIQTSPVLSMIKAGCWSPPVKIGAS